MKKIFTIALLTILTSTVALANDDTNNKQASKEATSNMVKTKETMKLIKKEIRKSSKMFREKNLVC